MAPARAACAWRSKTRDDGAANAPPHVREYIHLRKVLSAELNVAASKKQSHAMTVRAMRRSVPEGALTRALDEEEWNEAGRPCWTMIGVTLALMTPFLDRTRLIHFIHNIYLDRTVS